MSDKNDVDLSQVDISFLEHYGVKGMKWGVRRSQAELDRAAGRKPSKATQSKPEAEYRKPKAKKPKPEKKQSSFKMARDRAAAKLGERIKARKENKKRNKPGSLSVKDLSTRELQEITKRIELERKFHQLTAVEKKTMANRVETFVRYANLANNTVSTSRNLASNAATVLATIERTNSGGLASVLGDFVPKGSGKRRKV